MSFPQTAAPTETNISSNTTSPVITLPSVASGDLLLLMLGIDGATNVTGWDIFTSLDVAQISSTTLALAYRICNGSEGGTSTLTLNSSEQVYAHVYKITSWHGTTPPEVGAANNDNTGSSSQPDPPSLTASWGAEDNLWFAMGTMNTGARTLDTPPSGFGNLVDSSTGTGPGTGNLWSCRREENVATKDPGVATMDSTNVWIANTLVVRPGAGAAVLPGAMLRGLIGV